MLELRPATKADIPVVLSIKAAARTHDREPEMLNEPEIQEIFDRPHFDSERDARLVVIDGEVVGFGRVHLRPSTEREQPANCLGTVSPAFRGRGAGTALFRWQMSHATELLLGQDHDLPLFIRTWKYDWIEDAIALYERHGLDPVRWYNEMLRPLTDLPQAEAPPGVRLLPWDTDRDDEIRVVHNVAFNDHWGSTPLDQSTWRHMAKGYGTRLDLSHIAVADNRVIGYSFNAHYPDDEELLGRRDGWIGGLGVLQEWRKQGIASALIGVSLESFAAAGFTHASLGVDSDNPSGAVSLYTSLGFVTQHRGVTHQLEVTR